MNSWVAASIKKWSFVQGLGILGIKAEEMDFSQCKSYTRTHRQSSVWSLRLQVDTQCLSRAMWTRVEMFMCLCQRAGSYFL